MEPLRTRWHIKAWKVTRKHRFRLEKRIDALKGQLDGLVEQENELEARICTGISHHGPVQIEHQVYTARVETAFGDTCLRLDVQLTDEAAGRNPRYEITEVA